MKNLFSFFYITILSLVLFTSCADEKVNVDCYTCETTSTEYCIDEGDDFYLVITNSGSPTSVPLNGEFWSDVKERLQQNCENGSQTDCYTCEVNETTYCYTEGDNFYIATLAGVSTEINLNDSTWTEIRVSLEDACNETPIEDCFTCNDTETEYCFTEGDDFYTITIGEEDALETPLNGSTWEELKAGFINECADVVIDCYTCDATSTEYCYEEGSNFYTSTINGDTTEIDLNGQTWEEIRTDLENNCPSGITASLVGNWKINDFHGTTVSNTIFGGQTTTIESVQTAITHEAFVEFTENPNEYDGSGFIVIESVTNGQTTTYESQPFDMGTWVLTENELFLDGATTDPGIITELSETTLTIKYHQTSTTEDNGITIETTLDFTQSYTRQ